MIKPKEEIPLSEVVSRIRLRQEEFVSEWRNTTELPCGKCKHSRNDGGCGAVPPCGEAYNWQRFVKDGDA